MSNMTFKQLSISDLESLIKAASKEISNKKSETHQEMTEKISALLKQEGLIPAATPTGRRGPQKGLSVLVKYQDPNNPENTWTGRGRMPIWMMEAIRNGSTRDHFLLPDPIKSI